MKFKISSGLKNHIGKELITDDNVAIFELVKNSYDAGAKNVKIVFEDMRSNRPKIVIIDDGSGMSKEDLEKKWLFVAYSDKKDFSKNKNKRMMAGAKGIGRFSCDRLGSKLKIYTKIRTDKDFNLLSLNWNDFEQDQNKEFKEIDVSIGVSKNIREDYAVIGYSGTVVEISEIRTGWDWKKMQKLKRYLQRLINPLQIPGGDSFEMELIAKDFIIDDKKQKYDYDRVNGKIENIVYEKLKVKTTTIECNISEDGKEIVTRLDDKGINIFELKEKNNFNIKDINVKISFLNSQAKRTFTTLMGIEPVGYGNIFVFRNGFRVLPYGETEDDWLLINRRKAQGYNRYLGTRELLGRVEINDSQGDSFGEAASRSGGLNMNSSFEQLRDFVLDFAIKRLEKYVVGAINWDSEMGHKDFEDIKKDTLKIIKQIAGGSLENAELKYNEDFLAIVEKKTIEKIPSAIKNMTDLIGKEKDSEKKELYLSQLYSLKQGVALQKKEMERDLDEKQEEIEKKEEKLKIIETQNLFIKSLQQQDAEQLSSLFHNIGLHSGIVDKRISKIISLLKVNDEADKNILDHLNKISFSNKQISVISSLGSTGGITNQMDKEDQDLIVFILEYLENICKKYYDEPSIEYENNFGKKLVKNFIPFEMIYFINNFISNSKKAHAKNIKFIFSKINDELLLEVVDNGDGLKKEVVDEKNIFEKNFSLTNGSGLGLYDAKKIIKKIGGSISVERRDKGVKFSIKIKK